MLGLITTLFLLTSIILHRNDIRSPFVDWPDFISLIEVFRAKVPHPLLLVFPLFLYFGYASQMPVGMFVSVWSL